MENFMKQEFYLNTTSSILKNTVSNFNNIKNFNNTIHKINNLPINSPIFKKHLGIFITLYKKDTNELRGCIGTSETNNNDYTIETHIKKHIKPYHNLYTARRYSCGQWLTAPYPCPLNDTCFLNSLTYFVNLVF